MPRRRAVRAINDDGAQAVESVRNRPFQEARDGGLTPPPGPPAPPPRRAPPPRAGSLPFRYWESSGRRSMRPSSARAPRTDGLRCGA